uniref:Uncharacterized protein n=1 Tax=Anguilla anguilla TaxID=7936 RepID=A0A0E9RT43_ANGAN
MHLIYISERSNNSCFYIDLTVYFDALKVQFLNICIFAFHFFALVL